MKKLVIIALIGGMLLSLCSCSSPAKVEESSTDSFSSETEELSDELVPATLDPDAKKQEDESSLATDRSSEEQVVSAGYGEEIIDGKVYKNTTALSAFDYIIAKDKCRLLRYSESDSNMIVIPPAYTINGNDYPVEIEAGCFRETGIVSLMLPDTITEIPDEMCYKCEQLETVNLDNIKTVGNKAFYWCHKLHLEYNDVQNLETIGERVFCSTDYTGKYIMSASVNLGEGAFQNVANLSEVIIEPGVTEIPDYAFAENENLTKVTIPDTVVKIGKKALEDTNIDVLMIPSSVTELGDYFIDTYGYNEGTAFKGVIVGYKGSAAEEYCIKHSFTFSPLD